MDQDPTNEKNTDSPTILQDETDLHRIPWGEREILLVGTAHVSKTSVDLVRKVIRETQPDCVCVELDQRRYHSLSNPKNWEELNLKDLIRNKQLSTMIAQLILSSYQKRLGNQLGVMPGTELLVATQEAKSQNIPLELCDRDIGATLKRAWRLTGFWKKLYLFSSILAGIFDRTSITEEKLEEIRRHDILSALLDELGQDFPSLKSVLIDERDEYMANTIAASTGKRVVAIVGAGHVPGIKRFFASPEKLDPQRVQALSQIPPTGPWLQIIGWLIPAIIVGSLAWIGFTKGGQALGDNSLYWILANGIPSAVGATLALAHPLTILAAFVAAPITSLTPVIGAGYVTAFVQAWVCPPRVREIRSVADDIGNPSNWWKNRLLKVFLAFFLPGFGSMIGTWVGGYEIIKNLF